MLRLLRRWLQWQVLWLRLLAPLPPLGCRLRCLISSRSSWRLALLLLALALRRCRRRRSTCLLAFLRAATFWATLLLPPPLLLPLPCLLLLRCICTVLNCRHCLVPADF